MNMKSLLVSLSSTKIIGGTEKFTEEFTRIWLTDPFLFSIIVISKQGTTNETLPLQTQQPRS